MPLTAVAIATIFSSSTSSWTPRAPSRAAAWARCSSVVSGVAYQTVMPLPRRAGVLGMLRTTWSWPRMPVRAAVVAPGQDAQDELAAAQVRPDLAADPLEHLGLDAEQDDVGVGDGLDVAGDGPDAVLALEGLAPLRPRMAGHDLAGLRRAAPRSRPAIIASAMTPEPTVAMVASTRGDIGAEYSDGSARASRGRRRVRRAARRRARRTGRSSSTSTSSNPAARERRRRARRARSRP